MPPFITDFMKLDLLWSRLNAVNRGKLWKRNWKRLLRITNPNELYSEGYHLTTGVPVAIKIINKEKLATKSMDQKVRREIYNLRRFRHPHIIKLYEVIETQTDIFLVMELVGGGELFDYIIQRGKLSEVEARLCFQQMISAVGYCHHHKVAHRDLKVRPLSTFSTDNMLL